MNVKFTHHIDGDYYFKIEDSMFDIFEFMVTPDTGNFEIHTRTKGGMIIALSKDQLSAIISKAMTKANTVMENWIPPTTFNGLSNEYEIVVSDRHMYKNKIIKDGRIELRDKQSNLMVKFFRQLNNDIDIEVYNAYDPSNLKDYMLVWERLKDSAIKSDPQLQPKPKN